jgi:hypothetical protein
MKATSIPYSASAAPSWSAMNRLTALLTFAIGCSGKNYCLVWLAFTRRVVHLFHRPANCIVSRLRAQQEIAYAAAFSRIKSIQPNAIHRVTSLYHLFVLA